MATFLGWYIAFIIFGAICASFCMSVKSEIRNSGMWINDPGWPIPIVAIILMLVVPAIYAWWIEL
jgi:hypothetical protein